ARRLVVLVGTLAEPTIFAGQLLDRTGRRGLELRAGIVHAIGTQVLVILERLPGKRVVFLVHAEETSEPDHGEHDVVGLLVQYDVLNHADLVPRGVLDGGADHLLRTNGRGMSASGSHCVAPDDAGPKERVRAS